LVIASVAVPNLLRSNVNRNEAFAIAALKNISSAQAQFQASGIADPDGDGQGR
jgi:type II secretory pathway pseudopilin PulG